MKLLWKRPVTARSNPAELRRSSIGTLALKILARKTLALVVSLALAPSLVQAQQAPARDDSSADSSAQMVARGIEFLRTQGQAEDGSFSSQAGPGVTALVATALLRQGLTPDDPTVAKALAYLEGFSQRDGGIHAPDSTHGNYETCLALMCLKQANQNGRFDAAIERGRVYLKDVQWDETEGLETTDLSFGGAGYGSHQRPDLSNTSFFIETLVTTGSGPDDPAIQRALLFVSRCQNLQSEHNQTEFASKNPDGGFYYTCAAGGSSQAGETPQGGLRSYASMTYAGLKSMIYAGVNDQDPRVKAANDWISQHYSVQENPGMGNTGLYYYYHTFAKALDAAGVSTVADDEGTQHDWRSDLIRVLAERQNEDGSWTNAATRWLEGDPNLVTGYALLALAYCRMPAEN